MNYFSSAAAKVAATANAAIVAGAEVAKSTSTNVQHLVDEKYGISETKCSKCDAASQGGISNLAINISKGHLHNFQRCLICNKQYCPVCIGRTRYKIPGNKLYIEDTQTRKPGTLPIRGWCCCDCEEPLIAIWEHDFKTTKGRLFDLNIMTFLSLINNNQEALDYRAVAYSLFRVSFLFVLVCKLILCSKVVYILISYCRCLEGRVEQYKKEDVGMICARCRLLN